MQPIIIETIPQRKQKYYTVGDYFQRRGKTYIRVSEMGFRSEAAVAIHELVEKMLVSWHKISDDAITQFDIDWEERNKKTPSRYEEPGDDPKAPYHDEHMLAKRVEKMVVEAMDMSWEEHSLAVDMVAETDPRSK